jgi:hypothetical protein
VTCLIHILQEMQRARIVTPWQTMRRPLVKKANLRRMASQLGIVDLTV